MDLAGIKGWVEGHPWESVGLGGGIGVLFLVFLRHANGTSAVPAIAALTPAQQLAAQRASDSTQIQLAKLQEQSAVLPAKYATQSQTAQTGVVARMQDYAAKLANSLGLSQISASSAASLTGTQQYNLANTGLGNALSLGTLGSNNSVSIAQMQADAQIAASQNGQLAGGYGGNAGYGYASPYGYTPPYANPAAYLGSGGLGGLFSGISGLFGGGGGSGGGADYGGGGDYALTPNIG